MSNSEQQEQYCTCDHEKEVVPITPPKSSSTLETPPPLPKKERRITNKKKRSSSLAPRRGPGRPRKESPPRAPLVPPKLAPTPILPIPKLPDSPYVPPVTTPAPAPSSGNPRMIPYPILPPEAETIKARDAVKGLSFSLSHDASSRGLEQQIIAFRARLGQMNKIYNRILKCLQNKQQVNLTLEEWVNVGRSQNDLNFFYQLEYQKALQRNILAPFLDEKSNATGVVSNINVTTSHPILPQNFINEHK